MHSSSQAGPFFLSDRSYVGWGVVVFIFKVPTHALPAAIKHGLRSLSSLQVCG
ncbi:hypothetical protein [Limibacillus halophilus]|uniref:Uncharacterized protein n=1 Tax=Limibacillus halophilus TaxID=1579333 RepID=A0A839SPY9_9PROT|nr:hypothetical protein [Limibacillus halophilus]MBB3063914.1 hypothetical protein [Limibacillus halophilus]